MTACGTLDAALEDESVSVPVLFLLAGDEAAALIGLAVLFDPVTMGERLNRFCKVAELEEFTASTGHLRPSLPTRHEGKIGMLAANMNRKRYHSI